MPTNPALIAAALALLSGIGLMAHASVQSRLLRQRIARGIGTAAFDPSTGLYSAAAAWQCVRSVARRASRLGRPLRLHVATAPDVATLEATGRELAALLPASATGVRIGRRQICVMTCVDHLDVESISGLRGIVAWDAVVLAPAPAMGDAGIDDLALAWLAERIERAA